MEPELLAARIEAYEGAYFVEARRLVDAHARIADAIPEFLWRSRRIRAFIAKDGAVVAHYWDDVDSFEVEHRLTQRTNEVAETISRGVLQLGSGPPGDLEIAGLEIRREPGDGSDELPELVWEADFALIQVGGFNHWRSQTPEMGKSRALTDVLTFVNAHLLGLADGDSTQTRDSVIRRLSSAIQGLEKLIFDDPLEEEIQGYLAENPILLHPAASRVLPKHRFGTEFISDFVVEIADGEYLLIEIERPDHRIFTKAGDPSGPLRHGQRQIEDWQQWIRNNISYARKDLPGIENPSGMLVIGRSSDLGRQGHDALRRTNSALASIRILTYDQLLGSSRRHLRSLSYL